MHPFIHPLSAAVDPAWESRSDWNIFRAIAKKFSDVAPEVLGVEHDVVLSPILHDTAGELAQPHEPPACLKGECAPIAGVPMPNVSLVEQNYPDTFPRFTSFSPALAHVANGAQGIHRQAKQKAETP